MAAPAPLRPPPPTPCTVVPVQGAVRPPRRRAERGDPTNPSHARVEGPGKEGVN